jgi:site-specific DNA recombinase
LGSFVNEEHREFRERLKLTRLVPLQVRRWGFEMRLVIGGGLALSPKADPALLKAVARGFRWFNEIATGKVGSAADIARRENLDKHYVSRMIPLAFLAPSIVEFIAKGTQPPEVTTERLTRGLNLPFDWASQGDLLKSAIN